MFSRFADPFRVSVAGQQASYLQVGMVERSLGGARLDHALLIVDLGQRQNTAGRHLQDFEIIRPPAPGGASLGGAIVLVERHLADGGWEPVFWGTISLTEIELSEGEQMLLTARTEPWHFGRPLGFQRVFDPRSNSATWTGRDGVARGIYLDHPPLFNPEIGGILYGNKRVDSSAARSPYPIFVDPGSTATDRAASYQLVDVSPLDDADRIGERADENWNLVEAVQYLCGECNGQQTWIQNPTLAALAAVLPVDRGLLKNFRVDSGQYLPDALDQLLTPFGYTWGLVHESALTRRIELYKIGAGPPVSVTWLRPGRALDASRQDTKRVSVAVDLAAAANEIVVYGSETEFEATFYLRPAWERSSDGLSIAQMVKDGRLWEDHPENHRVWRDFVLNEAGDYPEEQGGAGQAFDLTHFARTAFGEHPDFEHPPIVPRRRKFLPMLTLGADGKPFGTVGGCYVEYFNPHKPGAANGGYVPIRADNPQFACRLLEDECGISFTGHVPPLAIRRAYLTGGVGFHSLVRITATVRTGVRLVGHARRQGTSPLAETKTQLVNAEQHFHLRKVLRPEFAEVNPQPLAGRDDLERDEADGRAAVQDFAEELRQAWDQADAAGYLDLEGCDRPAVPLGGQLVAITERDIATKVNAHYGTLARYPQIHGVRYLPQEQRTILLFGTFRETDAHLGALLRKQRKLK